MLCALIIASILCKLYRLSFHLKTRFVLHILALLGSALSSTFDLNLLSDKDAICNDGSAGGYYYRAPVNKTSLNFIIYQQGGAWCYDQKSCDARPSSLTSSKGWAKTLTLNGLLSDSHSPFDDSHKILIAYCSSDAHVGNNTFVFGKHFNGISIVNAVLKDLADKYEMGKIDNQNIIYGGGSAGARGAMVIIDSFEDMLKAIVGKDLKSHTTTGYLDSPLWVDIAPFISSFIGFVAETKLFHDSMKPLLANNCKNVYGDSWKCMFAQYALPLVKTKYVLIASHYDSYQLSNNFARDPNATDAKDMAYTSTFANLTIDTLENISKTANKDSIILSSSCYSHSTSLTTVFSNAVIDQKETALIALQNLLNKSNPSQSAASVIVDECIGFNCGSECKASTLNVF